MYIGRFNTPGLNNLPFGFLGARVQCCPLLTSPASVRPDRDVGTSVRRPEDPGSEAGPHAARLWGHQPKPEEREHQDRPRPGPAGRFRFHDTLGRFCVYVCCEVFFLSKGNLKCGLILLWETLCCRTGGFTVVLVICFLLSGLGQMETVAEYRIGYSLHQANMLFLSFDPDTDNDSRTSGR